MAKAAFCVRSAALLCMIAVACAYPTFWIQENEATAPPVANCLAHPTKKEGKHLAPQPDTTGTVTVASAAGKPVTAVCPGGKYTITLSFPQARRVLLTSSAGSLAKAAQPVCPGRSYTAATADPAETYEDTLTVPCNATGSINVAVTSATGSSGAFQDLTTKLTVSPLADCPDSTCTAAAGAATAGNTTAAGNATRAAAANGTELTPGAAAPGAVAAPAPAAASPPAGARSAAGAASVNFAVAVVGLLLAVFGL